MIETHDEPPRARGDRPIGIGGVGAARRPPPRTRGSTRIEALEEELKAASPAHAGIDLSHKAVDLLAASLPRARGDRPMTAGATQPTTPPPPRTRGSTRHGRACTLPLTASPAHAGIDPRRSAPSGSRPGLPRARGDRPVLNPATHKSAVPPPRTRGSTWRRRPRARGAGASPAHAGIDPWTAPARPRWCRLPRARGDRPWLAIMPESTRGRVPFLRASVTGELGAKGRPSTSRPSRSRARMPSTSTWPMSCMTGVRSETRRWRFSSACRTSRSSMSMRIMGYTANDVIRGEASARASDPTPARPAVWRRGRQFISGNAGDRIARLQDMTRHPHRG